MYTHADVIQPHRTRLLRVTKGLALPSSSAGKHTPHEADGTHTHTYAHARKDTPMHTQQGKTEREGRAR